LSVDSGNAPFSGSGVCPSDISLAVGESLLDEWPAEWWKAFRIAGVEDRESGTTQLLLLLWPLVGVCASPCCAKRRCCRSSATFFCDKRPSTKDATLAG